MTREDNGPETKPAGVSAGPSGARIPRPRKDPEIEALGISAPRPFLLRDDLSSIPTVDLLVHAIDADGLLEPDIAGKLLHFTAAWLGVLQVAAHACPELDTPLRVGDMERMVTVAGELHRRQRAALLDALAERAGEL